MTRPREWLVVLGFALLVLMLEWGAALGVRQGPLLLTLVVLCVAGIWRQRDVIRAPRDRKVVAALFVVSLTLALFALVLEGRFTAWEITVRTTRVLAGWTFFFWLPLRTQENEGAPIASRTFHSPAWIIGLLVVVFVGYAVTHVLVMSRYAILQDEVLYLMQSRWMTEPGFGWSLDRDMIPFFQLELAGYANGRMITQYPPGWPALLALFDALGLRWWTPVVLNTLAVGFTYLLGRRLHSPAIGIVAAALMATQPWIVESASGYMSHAATVALTASAAWLLVTAERQGGRASTALWMLSGFILGVLLATRPLTAVAIGLALVLWMATRGHTSVRRFVAMIAVMAAGSLLPVAGLLYYNRTTNGHPLTFGYQAVHGHLHNLGFGPRGVRMFRGTTELVEARPKQFTPARAVEHFVSRVAEFADYALPVMLVLVLLAVAVLYKYPFRWRAVSVFLVLPAAYFFYFFSEIRFYSELLPMITVAVAALLAHIATRNRQLSRTLLASMLLANVIVASHGLRVFWQRRARPLVAAFEELERSGRGADKTLVFVVDEGKEAYYFRRLSLLNTDLLESRVLVARDRGAENAALVRRLPQYRPMRAIWRKGSTRPDVVPLDSGASTP